MRDVVRIAQTDVIAIAMPFDRSTANGTSCDSERMDYSRNATRCAPGRVPPWCDMLVTGVRHGDRPLAPRRLRRCNAGIRHAGPRRARRRPLASGRMARLGASALATPAGRSARRTTHPLLALATRHARPASSFVLRDIGAPGTTPRQLSRAARPRSALTPGRGPQPAVPRRLMGQPIRRANRRGALPPHRASSAVLVTWVQRFLTPCYICSATVAPVRTRDP